MTKIEPRAIPVFESGITIWVITRQRLAPASTAASMTAGLMRAMELKSATIIKSVKRCT